MSFCSPLGYFSNFSNIFLLSLLRLFFKIKNFMAEKLIFPLFIFLFSLSCFLSFFSLFLFLSRGSDGRGRNTSPREMSGSNQRACLGWWFLARFGSNGLFLVIEWLVCDTDSPGDILLWMLIIISLCFLSHHFYSLYVHPPSSTLLQKVTGKIGQLEAVKLNLEDSMVCVEDQRKIVPEK